MAEEVIRIDVSGMEAALNSALGGESSQRTPSSSPSSASLEKELNKSLKTEVELRISQLQAENKAAKETEYERRRQRSTSIAREKTEAAEAAQAGKNLTKAEKDALRVKKARDAEKDALLKAEFQKQQDINKELLAAQKALIKAINRQEKEASSLLKKNKSGLSDSEDADLQKLIRQNKRLYNEEMSKPDVPEVEPSDTPAKGGMIGAFLQKFGSGLAGHHGGLRSILGGAAKGLGGAIGGGAGGAGGGAGGSLAGAAAGAPLGPLGIAAGVAIGKIAGDAISESTKLLYEGAKLIYESGEKFTEQGSEYSSVLMGSVLERQLKEQQFAMGLNNYSGSLSRFYSTQTDMQIQLQTTLVEIFESFEPLLSAGVITLTDILKAIQTANEIASPWYEKLPEILAPLNLLAAMGLKWVQENAKQRLEEAAKKAKENERAALVGMADFLGFGKDFANGVPTFAGAGDYMPANINAFNSAMGF